MQQGDLVLNLQDVLYWVESMLKEYRVKDIPYLAHDTSKLESRGTKFKFWFQNEFGTRSLYKEGRTNCGEDWSEKVASELCALLEIPHANYEFGTWTDESGTLRRGVVSESFLSGEDYFLTGLSLLKKPREPTLETVLRFWEPTKYLETFIGYLLFDAWIGNTDRHSENWGLIVHVTDEAKKNNRFRASIAPTFDHASSLGVRLSDTERENRLLTRDGRYTVGAYADRCKTPFGQNILGGYNRMKSHEVTLSLAQNYPDLVRPWLLRLNGVSQKEITNVFDRVPSGIASEVQVEFALALLGENMQRLMSLMEI